MCALLTCSCEFDLLVVSEKLVDQIVLDNSLYM